MKKALVVLLLLVAIFLLYRRIEANGPETHYRKFAEAVLHRDYDAAAAMADGISAKDLENLGSQERIGAGPAMFQTLFPSRFRIDSKEKSGSIVTLHATQTVLFNPAGVESAIRPAMYATLRQVVSLRKESGGWRVTAFSNTFEKMDSLMFR